ncbi:carboxymuconolactone decarboxylase family protein [Bdellovibrio sp. NC01]|uniref:carboxymuconolactone decarboxylase family protein n=1 Tax=Bdellovibrio sp. NC01 TaxID=2220073 RepID=UPI00115864B2|nr:peroxidase-related enzyme [Bdellovibrio sp. NC01]QDK38640.1 carboxymuconolactone decarboxylase family protein [Bdellovibrio sp. NC01]
MPHIKLDNQFPGIVGLMEYRPETGRALRGLAHALLVEDSSLSRAERELIASYVSWLNECQFCCRSHSAVASALLDGDKSIVEQVKRDYKTADISDKMKALLEIAGQVQKKALGVSPEMMAKARAAGASDACIHDAVLVASAFCMFNRYVDGLATFAPAEEHAYDMMAVRLKNEGYLKV